MGKLITTPRPKKLLDQVRDALRSKHYSIPAEEAYVNWIKHYILFNNKRHPLDMGVAEIEIFLTHLVVQKKNVAASTQNQALGALLFLCRTVLHKDLDGSIDGVRAKKPTRLPTVLAKREVRQVLRKISGLHRLMTQLLYDGAVAGARGHVFARGQGCGPGDGLSDRFWGVGRLVSKLWVDSREDHPALRTSASACA